MKEKRGRDPHAEGAALGEGVGGGSTPRPPCLLRSPRPGSDPRRGSYSSPPRRRAPLPPPSGPRSEPGPGSRHLVLPGRKMAAAGREKPPPPLPSPQPPARLLCPARPPFPAALSPGRPPLPSGFRAERAAASAPAVRQPMGKLRGFRRLHAALGAAILRL